jgi:hypothetical protein
MMLINPFWKKHTAWWLDTPFSTVTQLNNLVLNGVQLVQNGTGLAVSTANDANGALDFSGSAWLTTSTPKPLMDKDFNIRCEVFIATGSDYYSVFLAQRWDSYFSDTEFLSISDGRLLVVIYFSDDSVEFFTGVAIRNQWQTVEMSRVGSTFSLKVGVVAESKTINKTIRNLTGGTFNIGNANNTTGSGTCTGSMRNLYIQVAD